MREPTRSGDRLMTGRHLRWRIEIEVTLLGEAFDEIVKQFCKLILGVFVSVAAQCFEQLGCELPALDQRVEYCLLECFERAIGLFVEITPRIELAAAGES